MFTRPFCFKSKPLERERLGLDYEDGLNLTCSLSYMVGGSHCWPSSSAKSFGVRWLVKNAFSVDGNKSLLGARNWMVYDGILRAGTSHETSGTLAVRQPKLADRYTSCTGSMLPVGRLCFPAAEGERVRVRPS